MSKVALERDEIFRVLSRAREARAREAKMAKLLEEPCPRCGFACPKEVRA